METVTPSFKIVKQQSVGFSQDGASVYSTDGFVHLEISFKSGALRRLKGAPLSVFICLALHEADSKPGASLSTIESETGYTSPTVIDAIRFLKSSEHQFIEEIGIEEDGTKRYRPVAYAWFGPRKAKGGKISLPGKVFTPVVDSCSSTIISEKEQQQQLFCAETKKIFHAVSIGEPALSRLAKTVLPERAAMWSDWLSDPPSSFKRPAAYLVKRLIDDPLADPPGWTLEMWRQWCAEDEAERATAEIESKQNAEAAQTESGGFGTRGNDIWNETLAELKLQMTQATFDFCVRPTHAVSWNDGKFTVGVHSAYAKEWLENRLQATIQRTVTGIVGAPVKIEYVVADKPSRVMR